ncbi:metal-binding protein [Saccharopolyspora sp. NFXS83]|uniref:Ada metal-binding domain-containing protein n=1 Tax=Saccharopolyspora sp. NFXS83 TaxID=2993560 RepID=UPI00224B6A56|nr:Ada metal-binding domain-containing protein [Saccharopolyspora sp. NFXS83]MCX2731085.1 metal-binding protein [Saccharopolyspora sp. NFXS83]
MVAGVYVLLGPDGVPYRSAVAGAVGGHRRGRIYGRLDCRTALRALARGGYVRHRVFFADAATARAAGYRPCAVCLPERFRQWKEAAERTNRSRPVRWVPSTAQRREPPGEEEAR